MAERRCALSVLLLLVLLFVTGCTPRIIIDSTRNPQLAGPLSPVTFFIFEGSMGSEYTVPLRDRLNAQLARRSIVGSAQIITGLELNEGRILDFWASRSQAIVIIAPAGGTQAYGNLVQILYDVRVYHMVNPKDGLIVWRARASTEGGIDLTQRYDAFASDLISKLIADRVLPHKSAEVPPRTPTPAHVDSPPPQPETIVSS
jgi:hypothetical protein